MKIRSACAPLLALLLPTLASAAPPRQPAPPAPSPPSAAAVAAAEPMRVGNGVTKPVRLSGSPPAYTEEARRGYLQGVVVVEAVVDRKGAVTTVRVLEGLPMGLDQEAVKAVRTWKFEPATLDGRPVAVYETLNVTFQLEGADARSLLGSIEADRAARPKAGDTLILTSTADDTVAGRRTFADAWNWAQGYKGESRAAALVWVGREALRRVQKDSTLAAEGRDDLLEIGIAAEDAVLTENQDDVEAMVYKHLLLKAQAQAAAQVDRKQTLSNDADLLLAKANLTWKTLHPPQ